MIGLFERERDCPVFGAAHESLKCLPVVWRNHDLQRRFGPAIRREQTQYGLVRAVGIPLLWTVGIALFSWILVGAAQELSAGAELPVRHAVRPKTALVAAVLTLIGPVGAALLGVLATGVALRWTYQRWKQPPLMVRLIRG